MNLDNINKGKYYPKNPSKYIGDISSITYRSSWELFVMRWADSNPDVQFWGSEYTKVKYICETDKKIHTYFVDFTFKFKSGRLLLVEIKPEKYTRQPEKVGKSKQTFLYESLNYKKNKSKWKYAMQYAKDNNFDFQIWTENTLRKLGFKF